MRFVFILAAVLFRFALFTHAQKVYKAPEPETGPKPATEDNPSGATNAQSQYKGEAIGVPAPSPWARIQSQHQKTTCNANPGFDFNDRMGRCYNYAQNGTQLRTYASVIVSATAACSCQPNTLFNVAGMGDVGGCTPTNAPAAGTISTSTGGGSGGGISPVAALQPRVPLFEV